MRFNSLDAWLAWLEQAHPQEIDLGLERIRQVAERMQLTRPEARIISVAGTNGKGSCVATCAALLRAEGLRVGVYTSPHLLDYCERISIDGQPATETEICDAFAAIDAACGPVSLTYFEFGTLAALEVFRQRGVDIMVLEVGLGGRLDAVNLMNPDVAVVTSIDLDHMDWLGPDRDSIGREKAGIARTGKPLICADPEPPAGMLAAATGIGAEWLALEENFGFEREGQCWQWWGRDAAHRELAFNNLPMPRLPLPSVAAALQAVLLLGVSVNECTLIQVLNGVSLPGRFQRFRVRGRELILDVAHNPAATRYLAQRLRELPRTGSVRAVVAMMADKDRPGSLAALTDQVDAWYPAALPDLPRAATLEQLCTDLQQLGIAPVGGGPVSDCLERALAASAEGDRILVLGSFYTVAGALRWLQTVGGVEEVEE